MDKLTDEPNAIDPETTQDRWALVHNGKTFRQMWEEGGMEAMAEALRRVGITCEVTRTKVKWVRAPSVHPRLRIPRDVREHLVIKGDDFATKLWRTDDGRPSPAPERRARSPLSRSACSTGEWITTYEYCPAPERAAL
ncbi:hypothetical protein ACIBCM_23925 [Streptomyces sp. NPDC051018]|uniref:hypothetical protein n=1 Tax=Streptomyces sp. NPDC051018 TaxID=3365639 RepID=UPI0037BB381F